MHRFFYPILVLVTLAALAALAVPRDSSQTRQSVLGGGAARAQSMTDGGLRSQPYIDPGLLPHGPAQPVATTRPDSWPGGPGESAPPARKQPAVPRNESPRAHLLPPWEGPAPAKMVVPPAGRAADPPLVARQGANTTAMRPTTAPSQAPRGPGPYDAALEGAKVLARVGNDVILASEIPIGDLEEWIAANSGKVPRDQIEELRQSVVKERLKPLIETKLVLVDARRKVPEENLPKIMDHLSENFEEQEMKKLLRRAGVETRAELDAKLRQQGMTLDRVKRAWIEQQLAGGWLYQTVKTEKKDVTHEEMVNYYRDHVAEYDYPAKARWEQLMVRYGKDVDRAAARRKLAQMGNDVLRGVSLAEVAKAHSDGPTANDGGRFDWTSRGSLASRVLDAAIFGLPIGRLSQILEDERGAYIVRVIERSEAGRKTFAEVQSEIKKSIEQKQDDANRDQRREYVARLKREIPVWTVFDGVAAADATQATYQSAAEPPAGRSSAAPSQRDRYDARRQESAPPRVRR